MIEPELRNLAYISRWGIARNQRHQSVAEHSYFVTIVAMRLAQVINAKYGDNRVNVETVLQLALTHDWEELVKSDPPSPFSKMVMEDEATAKRVTAWVRKKMTDIMPWFYEWYDKLVTNSGAIERNVVKIADYMEAVLFCEEEKRSGNTRMAEYAIYVHGLMNAQIDESFNGRMQDFVRDFCTVAIDREATEDLYVVKR